MPEGLLVARSEEVFMEMRFLRLKSVIQITGKSRSAIYNDIKAGTFPRPIQLGVRAVAWPSTSIEAWQADRIAASKT